MEFSARVETAKFPVVYYDQRAWFSKPASSGISRFGGARAVSVEPDRLAKHLYRTITLELDLFGVGGKGIAELPLLFPFTLSGGKIEYVVRGDGDLIIESSRGKPVNDWPYKNYPSDFPSVPLQFSGPETCSFRQFAHGLPQGLGRAAEDKMIAVLPCTEALGVGIWFKLGEIGEDVVTIFEIDVKDYRVRAYNSCT